MFKSRSILVMHKRVTVEAENIGNVAVASGRQYPSLESRRTGSGPRLSFPMPSPSDGAVSGIDGSG